MATLPYPLDPHGLKMSSQIDEAGIIAEIIKHVPMARYFVEFGVDPTEGNCLDLHQQGWSGLFMDAAKEADWIKKEWVTPSNIDELLVKYGVPRDFGILSIDVDGQDFWIWREIRHRPPLVIIEYNGKLPLNDSLVMPRMDDFVISDQAYGASLKAMNNLGELMGYRLVYTNGNNAFFVQRFLVENSRDFQYEKVAKMWPTHHISDALEIGFIRW